MRLQRVARILINSRDDSPQNAIDARVLDGAMDGGTRDGARRLAPPNFPDGLRIPEPRVLWSVKRKKNFVDEAIRGLRHSLVRDVAK